MRRFAFTTALLVAGSLNASPVVAQARLQTTPVAPQAQHPLDGLSGREHWTIYDALIASGRTDSTTSYLYIGLNEPPKSEVLAWKPGQSFRREALVHLTQGEHGYEAIVDLTGKRVLSWTQVPARQYMTSGSEFGRMSSLVLADKRVHRCDPQARYHGFHTCELRRESRLLRLARRARPARRACDVR